MSYSKFFERATAAPDRPLSAPYPYQSRIAESPGWPTALLAPTASGKTEALGIAWLWRVSRGEPGTPTRLVYCLPQRVLVEQTEQRFRRWIANLGLDIAVIVLMGGAARDDEWVLHPERPTVIIGTQDMLLSRALNRGYGMSRYRWPVEAASLNNDVLWIFDEVQLAGVGLTTARQLEAARNSFGTFGPAASCYVSATLAPEWLRTVDMPAPREMLTLQADDWTCGPLKLRREAPKALRFGLAVAGQKTFAKVAAREVVTAHEAGTLTIALCNTVRRARELFAEVASTAPKGTPVRLLHSRFRPSDRRAVVAEVTGKDPATGKPWAGILISTQVIEAGVDVDARALFTDLAPWSSVVQRAGRCNRSGEIDGGGVFVVWDVEAGKNGKADNFLPYSQAECGEARALLQKIVDGAADFSPASIEATGAAFSRPAAAHALRRPDVLDLFDTSASIDGYDIDIARFVRDPGQDTDVSIFWRDAVADGAPLGEKQPRARREELCPASIGDVKVWWSALRARRKDLLRWDGLRRRWVEVEASEQIVPGLAYMAPADAGGYLPELGWAPESAAPVPPVPRLAPVETPVPAGAGESAETTEDAEEDDNDGDPGVFRSKWVPLREHAIDTADDARTILAALPAGMLPPDLAGACVTASQAHDVGKGHAVFQGTMQLDYPGPGAADAEVWAKSGHRHGYARRGFRHELASALAWLAVGPEHERDLIAYLLAAHHGKVRGTIRPLETDAPAPGGRMHARGVWDGDEMPAVDLGDDLVLPAARLSLDPMMLGDGVGGPSWVDRVRRLVQRFGPYRLLYLEALVIAADRRATIREDGR